MKLSPPFLFQFGKIRWIYAAMNSALKIINLNSTIQKMNTNSCLKTSFSNYYEINQF